MQAFSWEEQTVMSWSYKLKEVGALVIPSIRLSQNLDFILQVVGAAQILFWR